MREIAKATFTVEFSAIMAIIWKRMKDKTTQHHPLKCMVLVEFLMREGNAEMVFTQIQNNMFLIQALTGFSLADPATGIDVGYEVREKAQRLIGLIRSGFSDDLSLIHI